MKKKLIAEAKVGDLIKVPYKKGWHTYARVLIEGSYAFYDAPSTSDIQNYDSILNSDILFISNVNVFAVGEGHWKIVANIPLENRLIRFYPRYFNPAPTGPEALGFYEVYKEEIEDAIKKDWIKTGRMQLHGISGHMHVESRINDYYDGKRHEHNRRAIEIFKKMLGLP